MQAQETTSNPASEKQTGIVLGRDHVGIGRAAQIPVLAATPIVAVSPVTLPAPGRIVDLELKVTAPTTGENLPVILYSHGGGLANFLTSYRGAGPLVDFWAAHGFVVIQPTHLTSRGLLLDSSTPGAPALRIYVPDARVKAGIMLSSTGAGGDHLSGAAARFTSLRTAGFGDMTTQALVVIGDKDFTWELSSKGANYHADPYTFSPGPKSLLTLFGGEHLLGGVTGYDAAGTTDENPERVALIQRLSLAYLQSALYEGDPSWTEASAAFAELGDLGTIENK
jgi:hypothetical protein